MANRLSRERSPYLLQHADNPVDWYAWGDEAFTAARKEDKPIFLSIGYSTCHWCHVMAHESFEDANIGRILNRDFVSIKLDREERPDVDRVYMTFVQATTGAGGWPMSVWLTPDLKPFFGGTYFPPASRWGRPGFAEVLAEIARSWRDDRPRVLASAETMVERLRQATSDGGESPARAPVAGRAALDEGVAEFSKAFDARHGGFGGAPKFPRPSELIFLLESSAFTRDFRARQMALETLRAMALGGVRDHVGGGFHRYSVDAEWRVPHFEKMLYDQAQLVLAYLEASRASGEAFYATVAEDTLDYVRRELTSREGAFFSAEDADSLTADGHEKREGAFYVWTAAEIDALFGADAPIVRRRFGVEDRGNAPADPQGEFQNQNILYIAQSIEDVAARAGVPSDRVMAVLARGRQEMFNARGRRARPHLDDKVITAWNGLMIAAFARAARVLVDSPRREEWLDTAVRAAEAVRSLLWHPMEQRLLRRYRAGEAVIPAFCEDYAYLVWGLLELFQASGEFRWLSWAQDLTNRQRELFSDERDGGWFSTTGTDESVLLRLKEDYDGAEPAAASVTVRNLLTLGHVTGDSALRDLAGRSLERYGPQLGRVARVMPLMLANIVHWHAPPTQLVIVGERNDPATKTLQAAGATRLPPWAVQIALSPVAQEEPFVRSFPWLTAMKMKNHESTAYLCEGFACQAPVTDAGELDALLTAAADAAGAGGRIVS